MVEFGLSKPELKSFLENSLSSREIAILASCREYEGCTFSQTVKSVRRCAPSTTKLVMKRLKRFGLVDFGNNQCKGRPVTFTQLGRMFLEILGGGTAGKADTQADFKVEQKPN